MRPSRRHFLGGLSGAALGMVPGTPMVLASGTASRTVAARELSADLVITGGGLGGCAAALAALRNGLRVILTEETEWIGGQLTSQAVPPDEHRWIETHGANASYRELRRRIRDYYKANYPLTDAARKLDFLNPGNGSVSRLCHEPRVALAVLRDWLAPWLSSRQLILLTDTRPIQADVAGDRIRAVTVQSQKSDQQSVLSASYFIDATELGDLLPLCGAEFSTGAESRDQTGELHAADTADPFNQQAFTMCFAMDYLPDEDHVIDQPADYRFWRDFVPPLEPAWPGKLLNLTYTHPSTGKPKALGFDPSGQPVPGTVNLWTYRRLLDRSLFRQGTYAGDLTLVNWPQNDYLLGNLIGVSDAERLQHIERARQLSLSLLYWLQTEAPRADGGQGFPGLRLRGDVTGTDDGLAVAPYVRESRRIQALFTILEEHVGAEQRQSITGKRPQAGEILSAAEFADSVGVGSYAIDLHPSTGGDNYIDFPTLPFQLPLGSLIPQRVENLLAGCKNIGVTHVTGGCYRLHPVEWGIGEAAGCTVVHALREKQSPRAIRETPALLADLQREIQQQGVEIAWPRQQEPTGR